MLSTFLRILVDVAYLVPFKVKRFHTKHPNETVLVAGGSKAIRLKEDQKVSRGAKWIVAKRGVLILSDKRLVCGSWNIELDQIVNAQILKTKSFFVKALVLKIETKEVQHYQFGLQYDPKWIAQKVLPVKIEEGKIVSSQNFRVKCKNLVFCTRKVEIYNLIYPVLLRGYKKLHILYLVLL